MDSLKVNSEQINKCVLDLKKLLEACNIVYQNPIPEDTYPNGDDAQSTLHLLCQCVKISGSTLGQLINKTIQFLGYSSEMFETSDKKSANAINKYIENKGAAINIKRLKQVNKTILWLVLE